MKPDRLVPRLACAGVSLVLTMPALAHVDDGGGWGHRGMMWGGGGGWFMGPILLILLLVIAVAIGVLVARSLGGAGTGRASDQAGSSALRVLEERFARGEIDEEEFRQRKKALEE